MSLRQTISEEIIKELKLIEEPQPVLVTNEPFNVEELAITQFPAILVTFLSESRETITMSTSTGRRQGVINYQIRGFVRGTELDKLRNELITEIEKQLESDRYRAQTKSVVMDSQITEITVVERQPPLAEFICTFAVTYNYVRQNP